MMMSVTHRAASAIHRCSMAYARQGRQRSAWASSSAAVARRPFMAKLRCDRNIGGEERVALAEGTHGDVLGGPLADAGKLAQSGRRLRRDRDADRTDVRSALYRRGDAGERSGAGLRHPKPARSAGVESLRAAGKRASVPACPTRSPTGVPSVATMRPASCVAAFSVICWPSTARTAISKPSQPPGTRRAGPSRNERRQDRIATTGRRRWRRFGAQIEHAGECAR